MIKKFENFKLLKENPSYVRDKNGDKLCDMDDSDSKPFYCDVNDNHTNVINVYFGDFTDSHYNAGHEIDNPCYPGRLWTNNKIISFWTYPNILLFKSIIKKIENELNIKIFNNGWKIEVVRKNGEIMKTEYSEDVDNYYNSDIDFDLEELIPIEQYSGSENVSDREKLWHLMNAKEKAEKISSGSRPQIQGGSSKTAWGTMNDIRWRQAKYSSECKHYNR